MPNARTPPIGLYLGLLTALVLVSCAVLLVVSRTARRETRIVELLGPACDQAGLTHESLRRLVHNEFMPGVDKRQALRQVTEICLASR